jgi:hypothetical protein
LYRAKWSIAAFCEDGPKVVEATIRHLLEGLEQDIDRRLAASPEADGHRVWVKQALKWIDPMEMHHVVMRTIVPNHP